MAPAIAIGAWLAVSPDAVAVSAPDYVREAYIETDFEAYYSSEPAAQFASKVFVNNILTLGPCILNASKYKSHGFTLD